MKLLASAEVVALLTVFLASGIALGLRLKASVKPDTHPPIPLHALMLDLRTELDKAAKQRAAGGLEDLFVVNEVELEVSIDLTSSARGEIAVEALGAGFESKQEKSEGNRIRLRLKPIEPSVRTVLPSHKGEPIKLGEEPNSKRGE